MITRRKLIAGAGTAAAGSTVGRVFAVAMPPQQQDSTEVTLRLDRESGAFPHFWEKAMGSDRTVVGLRERWREDLVRAHHDTGMQSVRCHGLFDDEMGIAAAGASKLIFCTSTRSTISCWITECVPLLNSALCPRPWPAAPIAFSPIGEMSRLLKTGRIGEAWSRLLPITA